MLIPALCNTVKKYFQQRTCNTSIFLRTETLYVCYSLQICPLISLGQTATFPRRQPILRIAQHLQQQPVSILETVILSLIIEFTLCPTTDPIVHTSCCSRAFLPFSIRDGDCRL
jgi:hypothetical protein